jgi:hypothetical protein
MAKAEQTKRDYIKPDDEMLEQAQTMHDSFVIDKASFIAMYTPLADPFAANFQTALDSAQALPTSDEDLAELAVLTEYVDTELENSRVQYQKLISYVKILFPDSLAKQGIFGVNKYVKVYKSAMKMYDLMQLAYRKANSVEYKTDLIALGFTQLEINKLNTFATALYDANKTQEDFKQTIKINTEERITAYNTVWAFMVTISNASKQVFINDYAKIQEYLLYPEGESGLGKPQNLVATYDPLNPPNITLIWDAVLNATSYNVYYNIANIGAPSGNYQLLNNFPAPPAFIPSILAKRNYFKIKAKNDKQTSVYSDEVFVDVT